VLFVLALIITTLTTFSACTLTSQRGSGDRILSAPPQVRYVWSRQVTNDKRFWAGSQFEFGHATRLNDRHAIIGSRRGDLVAFDITDGSEHWRVKKNDAIEAQPLLAGPRLLIAGADGVVYALDPESGRAFWTFDTQGSIRATPAVDDNVLVVSNEIHQVYAINLETGQSIWPADQAGRVYRGSRQDAVDFTVYGHGGPTIHAGIVYVGFADGYLFAYDLRTGGVVWSQRLGSRSQRFRDVDATPVVVDETLYASSFAGGLYALNAASGDVKWSRDDIEGATTVTIRDGIVYTASVASVRAIDANTGQDLWQYPLKSNDLASAPVVTTEHVIVSLRRRGLLVLRRSSGAHVALVNPGGGFAAPVLALEDERRLVALSNTGRLYMLQILQ